MKITIEEQIAALEDTVRNHKSYIDTVTRYVAANERPKEILIDTKRRLPYIEAALNTLKWIKENKEMIIKIKRPLDK
jgi:prefoldin subunit 5